MEGILQYQQLLQSRDTMVKKVLEEIPLIYAGENQCLIIKVGFFFVATTLATANAD